MNTDEDIEILSRAFFYTIVLTILMKVFSRKCVEIMSLEWALGLFVMALFLSGCGPQDNNHQSNAASVASFPSKTITIVCPWGAGGGTDRVSRYLADALKSSMGVP
ncbi:MAG TPA: hypothetical protein DHV39_05775, partial [Verrucomicrobiales bacterium]|nr:hypothetical protein [Verrucomicrobiales bacterium]